MEEEIKKSLDQAKTSMEKAVAHLQHELSKIKAGKAAPDMLDSVKVNYYGTPTALSQVAAVSTPDARTLAIKPWEKSMLKEIEIAIRNSDLGLNPQNDGEIVRINIPPLTEERRKALVKQAKQEAEQGKVSIRNIRQESNKSLDALQKKGAAEDSVKKAQTKIQENTDAFIKKIDEILVAKEKDIMTV
jgi:ribosome recycling factor